MGEPGWREFLAAAGGDNWVVLRGGATAVFRVASLSEAARMAEAVSGPRWWRDPPELPRHQAGRSGFRLQSGTLTAALTSPASAVDNCSLWMDGPA